MFPRAIGDKLPPVAVSIRRRYRMEQPAAGRLVPCCPLPPSR